jgi:XTP/dITP diphosphohydrolase
MPLDMLLLPHTKLVLATHNKGKVPEIAALLEHLQLDIIAASELGIPEPIETEATFTGNALLKARHAAAYSGLPALADDSGLSVTALGGAPGIYSARWAGETKNFTLAMQRVHQELLESTTDDYRAEFVCALALCLPDGREIAVEGRIDGTLVFPARGEKGFGYDPIFVPLGETRTFAEMPVNEKHAISHRARAFEKLLVELG